MTAPTGYTITLEGRTYDAYRRGPRAGEAFRLVDCWREAEGCRGITIYAPTGRVVLAEAGNRPMSARKLSCARTWLDARRLGVTLADTRVRPWAELAPLRRF